MIGRNKRYGLVIAMVLILPMLLTAQNRQQLEQKRKDLLQSIRHTDGLLKETAKNKELMYEQYITIQKQIRDRNELLTTIQEEIQSYDTSLARTEEVISALQEDIQRLKKDYQVLIQMAYKRKLIKTDLLFLFSSDSFNEAYKRWQYLKQYDKYRKKQATRIIETQQSLERKIQQQKERKAEKEQLLQNEKEQLQKLQKELSTKDKLLKKLKSNETSLRKKIKKKKRTHESLNAAIENIIQTNMTSTRRKNRTTAAKKSIPKKKKTSSLSFTQQRGKLPWPARGVVSSYFGKQDHPTLKDIVINNNGIDILLKKSSAVKAVADGEVVSVRYLSGLGHLVVIKHGDYYTLYSKLKEHQVKKGKYIQAGEVLGYVGTKNPELHFEVWQRKKRLNPMSWLKRGR